ncbi:peptidoglycan-binding protein [Streptomyces sp. CO7]
MAGAEVASLVPAAQVEAPRVEVSPDGGVPAAVAGAEAVPSASAVQDAFPQAGVAEADGEAAPHAPVAQAAAGTGSAAPVSVVREEEAARVGGPEGGGRPPVTQGAVARTGSGGVRALAAPRNGGAQAAPMRETAARDRAGLRPVSRGEIIERARRWTEAGVPYDMERNWADGYRQDCSGFVSMAWDLPGNAWTGNLDDYAVRISHEELSPGDILLFHNDADPQTGSHVVIFGGWTDYTHTRYVAYEQTRPHAVRRVLDHPYPVNGDRYVPYRYRALAPGGGSGEEAAFPGRASFGPGATNAHVTRLGRMLVERGGARFYTDGPGPRWGDADRRAVQAFQRAQGWAGKEADGLPGPHTWRLLVTGRGRDIPPPGTPSSHGVTGYPGRAAFRPGAKNAYVTQLGRQLVKKGYGRHYTDGPSPEWTDADRRAVQAFQRAQGWRGGAADGYPGPETWRRLFS